MRRRVFQFSGREWRRILSIAGLATLIGGAIGALSSTTEVPTSEAILIGASIGLWSVVLSVGAREIVWNSSLVRLRFGIFSIIDLGANALAIGLAVQLAALPFGIRPPPRAFVIAAAVALVMTGWTTIDRFLGRGVLVGLLSGRYHHPRHEQRVFLFADLADSTPLAQRLGDLRFHRLLDRLFGEVGRVIDRHRGTVHRYVGDEVIAVWPPRSGIADGECVRCSLAILDRVAELEPDLVREFGVAPRLRIALHAGDVVVGEISGVKREIVFSGDAVNTTARIEGVASEMDRSLVVSGELLARLELPDTVDVDPLGAVPLKGRAGATELYVIVGKDRTDGSAG